jgi:lipoate-protein ligase B
MDNDVLRVIDLGCVDYDTAWQVQKETVRGLGCGLLRAAVIVCRHFPVITLGRGARRANILVSGDDLKARGIAVYTVERGGDVTYHGPGQITAYPVLDLRDFKKDIRWYLRSLEQIGMDFLADFGVASARKPGSTGIWIGERKISSIGIAIKNWVTYHGITINIQSGDMFNFSLIRPCGMDVEMTSLETELREPVMVEEAQKNLVKKFQRHFCISDLTQEKGEHDDQCNVACARGRH